MMGNWHAKPDRKGEVAGLYETFLSENLAFNTQENITFEIQEAETLWCSYDKLDQMRIFHLQGSKINKQTSFFHCWVMHIIGKYKIKGKI